MVHGGLVDLVLEWRMHMAEDDAKARERRVFNHSRCGFASSVANSWGAIIMLNFMIPSLSEDHKDMYSRNFQLR